MNWDVLAEGRHPRRYRPGQLIYLQGTQPDHFYYLLSGTAPQLHQHPVWGGASADRPPAR